MKGAVESLAAAATPTLASSNASVAGGTAGGADTAAMPGAKEMRSKSVAGVAGAACVWTDAGKAAIAAGARGPTY